jgi:uncharacterized protein (DUF736 family)
VCPACGAPVDVARIVDTDRHVALEPNTDASNDAPRYRVLVGGPELVVERVPDDAAGDFYPEHHFDCPQGNAGRTF